MDILEIDKFLLVALQENAKRSERLRVNYDLRTTAEDGSQRMLNALRPGTKVAIHRHLETTETTVCLQGKMDVVFFDVRPNDDCGGPMFGTCGTAVAEGMEINMFEVYRVRLCPEEGKYGVQIPVGAWHSVEVYEPSVIFEAKDGAYGNK